MNVTDEMVEAALKAWREAYAMPGFTFGRDAMRETLEAAFALSHAAGQDGEQCRAASGEPVAWIRTDGVTTSDAGLMRLWEAQGLQFDPLIRALSRGVPEGMVLVPSEPTPEMETAHRMYGDTSDWWQAVTSAAIAAQRKEGE